jgi:plasmid stability protein
MNDFLIRDMPDSLKQDLTEIARDTGRSMSDEAKALLWRGISALKAEKSEQPSRNAYEELRKLFAPLPGDDGEFSKIMDEIEAERKKDFGRPFSFDE